jgi:hypothetical protein
MGSLVWLYNSSRKMAGDAEMRDTLMSSSFGVLHFGGPGVVLANNLGETVEVAVHVFYNGA